MTSKLHELLLEFHGIGDAKATVLAAHITKHHAVPKTRAAAKALLKKHYIAELNVLTLADLEYDFASAIPRGTIGLFERAIPTSIRDRAVICGSYRREKPTSNDIDLVMYADDWPQLRDLDTTVGDARVIMREPFQSGASKIESCVSIIMNSISGTNSTTINIKIDVFFTTPAARPFAMLYATGSGIANIRMRVRAKRLGYCLNQSGLYKLKADGSHIARSRPASSEREIFEHLNLPYLEPQERSMG